MVRSWVLGLRFPSQEPPWLPLCWANRPPTAAAPEPATRVLWHACVLQSTRPLLVYILLCAVYFPNISAFMTAAANPSSSDQEELPHSCRAMHPGWQYVFWDWEAATQLVSTVSGWC